MTVKGSNVDQNHPSCETATGTTSGSSDRDGQPRDRRAEGGTTPLHPEHCTCHPGLWHASDSPGGNCIPTTKCVNRSLAAAQLLSSACLAGAEMLEQKCSPSEIPAESNGQHGSEQLWSPTCPALAGDASWHVPPLMLSVKV